MKHNDLVVKRSDLHLILLDHVTRGFPPCIQVLWNKIIKLEEKAKSIISQSQTAIIKVNTKQPPPINLQGNSLQET